MQIVAAANNHYRVGLPDGTSGYVSATGIESTESNIQSFLAEQSMALQDSPTADGIQKSLIHTGEVIDILAEFQNHWLIRVKGHGIGWLSVEALASPGGQTSQETGPLTNQR
jgi:SH3-like domain-containing protein